jgi:DMSO/TMAO reductase YedYZ heme-binding membrane subunit
MNAHFWWYVARGAGVSSWFFGATAVLTGLLMSSKADVRRRPNWQLDLHRYQGALALALLGLHVVALIADRYSHFTMLSVLVPFVGDWKAEGVAWGVVAMYLLLAVEVTSLLRRRISASVWRTVHLSSLVSYVLSTVHFVRVGSDVKTRPAVLLILGLTAINLGLLLFRILADKPTRRPPGMVRPPMVPSAADACNDGPR